MTSSSTPSASSSSRPMLLKWLLLLLVPAVIFGTWWIFFQLFTALGIGDTESKHTPLPATISTHAPSTPDDADRSQPSAPASIDTSESTMDAEIGVSGGHLLDPGAGSDVPYWQAVIDQVALDQNDSLVVGIAVSTPPQDRTVIEPQAVEVCQRFAEEMTDGKTGFTMVSRDGDALATNIIQNGSDLTECYMP